MKKILYTFAALLFFAACTQEQVIPEEPVIGPVTGPTDGLVSVTLVADSPETRSELGILNNKPFPFWSAGDNVWVLPAHVDAVPRDQYGNAVYPATLFEGGLTEASQSASFTGEMEAGRTYLAFYPDREGYGEDNGIYTDGVIVGYDEWGDYDPFPFLSFSIPTEQYPTRNSFDKAADFLISEPFSVTDDQIFSDGKATVNVGFTRMNAIVKVVLHDQTTDKRLSGQVVKRVVLGDYQEMEGGEYAPAANAETRAAYFDPDGDECYGLAGSVHVYIGEDGKCEYGLWGEGGIAAIYTDGTNDTEDTQYAFDEDGLHTTYFITMPCVIKNDDCGHGLRIRVETDDMIIERDVTLPDAGVALQPSRMTTLNIGLYDNGVKETTIMENGFSFMWYDSEAEEFHTVSSLSVKEDTYEELIVNLVGLSLDEENWVDELVSYDPEGFVHVDFGQAYYDSYSGQIYGVRVWGDQVTDSPVTVTFSAGGYSTDLQVNVVEANTPASISLGEGIHEINLDQYDAPSLNATIAPKDPGQSLDADFERFACKLVDQVTGEENTLNEAFFEELDELEMVIHLPEISEAGEFNLVVTYKDVTLLTIPTTVWEDADLPAALQGWSGPSRSDYWSAPSDKGNWFETYKNAQGGLKTYAASLAEEIPTYAFAGALKLESSSGGFDAFKYFTGLTEVPEHAFVDCQFLTEITLPGGIITIGDSAFENCKSLINIRLPESVTSIGNNAFVSSGVVSINLPDGLESIGESAFWGCGGLLAIEIPGSIKTIGDSAFSNAGLSEVSFSPTISQLEKLPLNVFYGTASLTSISIPQSVKVIGVSAFSNSGLASVVIPEGVTTIEEYAFSHSQLTTVTLPSSVTSIGEYAFANCPMVSATLLPVTPPTVWGNAFRPTSENENFEYPIYVPDNSYDSYISAAASWGEAAGYINTDRIKKMSEAPVQ